MNVTTNSIHHIILKKLTVTRLFKIFLHFTETENSLQCPNELATRPRFPSRVCIQSTDHNIFLLHPFKYYPSTSMIIYWSHTSGFPIQICTNCSSIPCVLHVALISPSLLCSHQQSRIRYKEQKRSRNGQPVILIPYFSHCREQRRCTFSEPTEIPSCLRHKKHT